MDAENSRLIEAALGGAEDALSELLERHRGPLTTMALSLLGNRHDAEDVCQETFLAVTRQGLGGLREPDRFRSWLLGIGYRKARDLQRRSVREREAIAALDPPGELLPEHSRTELNMAIAQVLSGLPGDVRTALNLRYHGGLSYGEIAALMEVPVSTVRGCLYRGTKKLRSDLKRALERQGK